MARKRSYKKLTSFIKIILNYYIFVRYLALFLKFLINVLRKVLRNKRLN